MGRPICMTTKSFSCRYAGKSNGHRYEMWQEEFARRWLSIDFAPVTGNCIANEIRGSEHAFLGLCAIRGSLWSDTIRHPREHSAGKFQTENFNCGRRRAKGAVKAVILPTM